jgi:23S rRNA (uracil1939-C5)-methyltransferase
MNSNPVDGTSPAPVESDQLVIESIIAGGDGIARRSDGCVVFVPRAAPGDRVEVAYTEIHKQWRRARIVRVIESGPDRTEPPCPYYALCGGCQLQHLVYQAQLTAKAGIIAESFRRIGKFEVPEPGMTPSEGELEYRNRISLILTSGDSGITAGYHALDDPGRLVDIDRCAIAEPAINRVWKSVIDAWRGSPERMPSGPELRLTLRATARGAVGLAIEGARTEGDLDAILDASETLSAVWLMDQRGSIKKYAGMKTLDEERDGFTVRLAGTSFMQVNRATAGHVQQHVREQCGDVAGSRIIDAYCGYGLNALELARLGARVLGIDADQHAVKEATRLASGSRLTARFQCAPVEQLLKKVLPASTVILNPPRRGVVRPVIKALLDRPPARIIYASCNPATLARDLNGIAESFDLVSCRAFDLFPQTAHVETVAVLDRRLH